MTVAPKDPKPTRSKFWERVAPDEIDWRSLVLIPLLAVLTALIIGAIFIAEILLL